MPVGDTFYLGNPDNPKSHLYVVISRPDENGSVLCVSFSSLHPGVKDRACILEAGIEPYTFLVRDSFMDYGRAKEVDVTTIRINTNERRWHRGERVPDQTLRKIQDGARKSAFLPIRLRKYFDLF